MTRMMKTQEAGTVPVVALHSSGFNALQWDGLIADLGERYDVFAYDLPGYGTDRRAEGARAGMDALARTVLDKIADLGEPVHLVGHSFGGSVAIRIALTRPDLVSSLTLYEPTAFFTLRDGDSDDRDLLDELKRVGDELEAAIADGSRETGMQALVDFWNGDGAWQQTSANLRGRLAALAEVFARDFRATFAEALTADDLSRLTMPVLLMMGMDSPEIAQRTTIMLAEKLPRAELAMLSGLGHMAPVVAPQWVNPRIVQHIARVERSAKNVSWPHRAAA